RARAAADRLSVGSDGQSPHGHVAAAGRRPARRRRYPDRALDRRAGYETRERARPPCVRPAAPSRVMKIAVIFDALHPEWEDADFKREIEQKAPPEEAEYDVARGLIAGGHDILMIGIGDSVGPLVTTLADFHPNMWFSGGEGSGTKA